jgi:hypothetical protein
LNFQQINQFYNLCNNPEIILHPVESPLIKRFDKCVSFLLRQANQDLANPTSETISSHLKKIRWNLLSETRCPEEFLENHKQEFDFIKEHGGATFDKSQLEEFEKLREELSYLQYNPLTTALADFLYDCAPADIDNENEQEEPITVLDEFVVIPFGSTRKTQENRRNFLREVLNNLDIDCDVLTYAEARQEEEREEPRSNAVFLATPLAFGQSSVNCPLANRSHFFFYDFITFDKENTGWKNNFPAYSENIHEAHGANFHEERHENRDTYVNTFEPTHLQNPPTNVENSEDSLENYVVKDSDLYQPTEWKSFQSDDSENPEQNLIRSCLAIRIQSENNLKAFLPLNSDVTKLSKNRRNLWGRTVVDPEDLEEDDYILLLQQEPEDHANNTLNHLDPSIIESLKKWFKVQTFYRNWITESCWTDVKQFLNIQGIAQPYETWFDEGKLGPQSFNSFRILCENTDLHLTQEELTTMENALRTWHAARIGAGHDTADYFAQKAVAILNQLTQENPDFEQSNDSTIKVTLNDNKLGSYVIGTVESINGPVEVPQHLCRRILNYRGKPWLQ